MSTLERLKVLYEERHREHFDIEVWDNAIEAAWPKLLAVVEAAKRVNEIGSPASYAELNDAIKALGEETK